MTLCRPAPNRQRRPTSMVRAAGRRATIGRESRVAVWDVDDVFPSIERTLDAMNDAQELFGFELADMSAPLGVWDLNRAEGTNFLWAERVAQRLASRAAELGVDLLACVTRHWLRDNDWLYLYGWWPDGGKPPVVLDRAIANTMVACLAGFYGNVGTHATGAKDCPLAFNQRRDLRQLVGPQKFDARCRRQFARKLGSKMAALESLLKLFAARAGTVRAGL